MSEVNIIQKRIDEASIRLGKIIVLDDFTWTEIPTVVFHAMEISSEFMELKGKTKKKVVLSALKSVVHGIYGPKFDMLNAMDSKSTQNERDTLQQQMDLANNLIDTIVPTLIDTLAWVTKQKIKFNPKTMSHCLGVCLPVVANTRV
jgi:hypothetical protein